MKCSAKGSGRSPAACITENQPCSGTDCTEQPSKTGKAAYSPTFPALIPVMWGWLRHAGLQACPDRAPLLPESFCHPLYMPLLQHFKSLFHCVGLRCVLFALKDNQTFCVYRSSTPSSLKCLSKPLVTFQTAVASQSQ